MSQEPPEDSRFPDIPIESIKRSSVRYVEDINIDSRDDLARLLDLIYEQPEIETYLFCHKDQGCPDLVLAAQRNGMVEFGREEARWYAHPNFQGDFIRIRPDTDWDWEKVVLANEPMYMRIRLSLTQHERQKRDLWAATKAVRLAGTADQATGWRKLENHYNRNQLLYWGVGLLVSTIVGVAITVLV